MTRTTRLACKARSNNPANSNQNVCALAVARAFGVAYLVRYLHTWSDMKRALMTCFSVRSRLSSLQKNPSVGNSRARIKGMIQDEGALGAVAYVKGHVICWDRSGNLTDTDPRKADRRKIIYISLVFRKA